MILVTVNYTFHLFPLMYFPPKYIKNKTKQNKTNQKTENKTKQKNKKREKNEPYSDHRVCPPRPLWWSLPSDCDFLFLFIIYVLSVTGNLTTPPYHGWTPISRPMYFLIWNFSYFLQLCSPTIFLYFHGGGGWLNFTF